MLNKSVIFSIAPLNKYSSNTDVCLTCSAGAKTFVQRQCMVENKPTFFI